MTAPSLLQTPSTTTGPAIHVRGLCKRYGSVLAVDDVELTVARSAVHGLLGPNGAGKTTLLRTLLGLVRPDRGVVEIFGRSPNAPGGTGLHGVAGFVESPRFYPYLSAARNLDLLAALDGPEAGARVDDVLASVGLSGHAGRRVGGFSTGMRQRLGIAAALLRDPHLLILDEPTSGLDPRGIHDLHELIAALADSGRTVLLSSHDLAEVERLCDSVTVLNAGRVVYDGTLADLRSAAPAPTFALRTSDDSRAAEIGRVHAGVEVASDGSGLTVHAHAEHLDGYVISLGAAGIAVRSLTRRDTTLEALFLRLTSPDAGERP